MNKTITRLEWDYTNNVEFNKYIKMFLEMSKQMSKDMSVYDYDTPTYDTPEKFKNDIKNWYIPNKAKIFFFFEETSPIGYTILTPSKYKSIRAIWVSEIFINVQYRHKGYGTILMSDILSHIKEQNYQRVFLTVFEKNAPARALYDKFKFTTFDRVLELGIENLNSTQSIAYLDIGNENITVSNRIRVSDLPKNVTWYFSTNTNLDWKAFATNNETWAGISLALAKAHKNIYIDKDKTTKNAKRNGNVIYCNDIVLLRKESEFSIYEDVEVYTINTNQLISLADELKDLYFIQETPNKASIQIWRSPIDYYTLIQRLDNLIGLKYTSLHIEASHKPKLIGNESIEEKIQIFTMIISALSALLQLADRLHDFFNKIKSNRPTNKTSKQVKTYRMNDCLKNISKYIEITDKLNTIGDPNTINQLIESIPTIKKQLNTLDELGWYNPNAERVFTLIKTLKSKVNVIYSKYKNNPGKEYDSDLKTYFNKMYRFIEEVTSIAQILIGNTSSNEPLNTLYKQSLAQYNYLSKLDFNSIATESFNSSIVRFLTGILNVLTKIVNNVHASILGLFKELKRTELQYYIDANKFSINRILSVRYDLIANLSVPIPLGMITPYRVTTEKINICINNLDMMNRMIGTLDSIDNLVNALLTGSNVTIENNTLNMGELTAIENAFKNESKCFSVVKRNSETEFSKVFPSDHCLKDTFTLLDQATKEEYNVTKVYAILETIYQKFEQIITLVSSEGATLTKNDLLLLSAQTTTLAKIFDIYGVTMQDLQRVEHNFIFVMKQIKEHSGI